jgi:hypothetical protein
MIYKYCTKGLEFKRVKLVKPTIYASIILGVLIVSSYFMGRMGQITKLTTYEREVLMVRADSSTVNFSKEKFATMLKDLNVKFPHIVMAQSIIETGQFKSTIFKTNHNLFGMKEANRRITTAQGTQLNHAYYNSWQESVYDYAFFQCRYLGQIQTEEEYYAYLGANYAEASNYVQVLKSTIEREGLKQLFN